jgi:putative nucleotidyltransferase with HDIG domain
MRQPSTHERFSEPASANSALQKILEGRREILDSIPTIPAILQSLLTELDLPPEDVNLLRVAELVGRDESLSAQCLRMANSVRFGRARPADSLRGAVRTLGLSHIRDLAVSSSVMKLASSQKTMDPAIFWKHSLGSAIVSRKLARTVGFHDPEKAYLASLLHDLGYIVNILLTPQRAKAAIEDALEGQVFMGEAELDHLGYTHCQTGELLARHWRFPDDVVEAMLCHHNPAAAAVNPALVAMVSLADRLCRSNGLGLGYAETPDPASEWQSDWDVLAAHCSSTSQTTWPDFVKDSDAYFKEIRELVAAIYNETV